MKIKTQPSKDYNDSHSDHLSKLLSARVKKVRLADVGALDPVLEKSATEPKLKQNY